MSMTLYVVLPENVGAVDADLSQLTAREREAREQRAEALGEMQALIDHGYDPVRMTMRYTEHGTYKVFEMERPATPTDLDPQTHAAAR